MDGNIIGDMMTIINKISSSNRNFKNLYLSRNVIKLDFYMKKGDFSQLYGMYNCNFRVVYLILNVDFILFYFLLELCERFCHMKKLYLFKKLIDF
jgi:hypothetical protein